MKIPPKSKLQEFQIVGAYNYMAFWYPSFEELHQLLHIH
jgi:hypothetical protein